MESFATPAEMQERTGGIIAATHPFLAKELASATRAIRLHCGWHIAGQETRRFQRVRPYHDAVWLPAMEIVSITSATVNGAAVDVDTIDFDPQTGWTSLTGRKFNVSFVAGFEEVPADLVTLTLELAAGALISPLGISREQAGGVSVTLNRTSNSLLVGPGGADAARLEPYRLGVLP
ncbi:hypothetical protein SAMN04488565_0055 [Leucobacter chromiiresistens]|uniref:Uncharacterized protein n=3 Tax=Leucobacter chromiiresistens TaxID=1079994 RepID=A0A1H0XQF9_9MICO|nr:hypothetical protein SAMN04488565_0055 [Leucobacter chromiiresistens]